MLRYDEGDRFAAALATGAAVQTTIRAGAQLTVPYGQTWPRRSVWRNVAPLFYWS